LNAPPCRLRCAIIASRATLPYHSHTTLATGPKKREYYTDWVQQPLMKSLSQLNTQTLPRGFGNTTYRIRAGEGKSEEG